MTLTRGLHSTKIICTTWLVCALLCIAAIGNTNNATVSALIAGEPTNILYDRTHNSPPDPPADPDADDDEEFVDPYSGCISRSGEGGNTSDSSAACPFVFKTPQSAFRTDSGEFKVVILGEEQLLQRRKVAIGLLSLEANALLLPQYLNGPTVFYVHRGQAHLSYVDGKQRSKMLVSGDVFAISAGTPFYIVNAQSNQNLQVLLLVELSDMPGKHASLECFYVAGGLYPTTVMSGFSEEVLAAAFKVTSKEIQKLLSMQKEGPIINATQLQPQVLASITDDELAFEYGDQDTSIFNKKKKERHHQLLDERHIFRNENGWSVSMSKKRYRGLEEADVGMFAVGLKSGCMVAPYWNPRMTEIGIVTHGRGVIQVVSSNGTTLVDVDLEPGSVFIVPRYHPSSKLAANNSDFEYVGFTTSSHPMQPYFLAGTNAVFNLMDSSAMSMAFNITKYSLQQILGTQPDKIILTREESNW